MPRGSIDRQSPFCRMAACAALLLAGQVCVADSAGSGFSGIATLTSDYIYRGLVYSDGDPSFQLGLDYEHESGAFAGIWGSTIDWSNSFGERDTELDYYVGFQFAARDALAITATLVRYTYPGQTGTRSYDYNEALVTATLFGRYSAEFGYAGDRYGLGNRARHLELRSEWPVANAWVISAGAGRNDLSDFGASAYLYWDLGASARFSRLIVDLRGYGNERPAGGAGTRSAGSQLVVSLSVAF